MRTAFPLLLLLAQAACATVPDAPIVDDGPVHAEGAAVALRQPVALGGVVVTPIAVVEDSRCPMNARCVWAGRIVVTTRIDGAGWRETRDLELGKPQQVRDHRIMLASARPHTLAGQSIDPSAYRFTFEGGDIGIAPD